MSKFSPTAEPVAWMAAVTDVVAAATFFAHIAPEGTALVTAAAVSILAVFTRSKVSPTA